MMKKLMLILSMLMLLPGLCFAEFFCTQRGDTDIFVLRNNYKPVLFDKGFESVIEIQRIVNYKDKDKTLVHIYNQNEYDNVEVAVQDTDITFPLQEIKINTDFVLSEGRVDKWFAFNAADWQKLANDKEYTKIELVFHTKDGKAITKKDKRINVKQLFEITEASHAQLQELKQAAIHFPKALNDFSDDLYYKQPYFSMYFPGKTYKEVTERYCYNLNGHRKNGKIDYGYYVCQYAFDDARKTLGFKTLDFRGKYEGRNFIWFVENPKGTYLNYMPLSFSENGTSWLPCYKSYPAYENYHVFNTLRTTYEQFYGYNNYGFTLKKYKSYDFDNIRVDEIINPTLLAILEVPQAAAKKSNYRISAVNGKPTKNMTGLEYDVLTVYNNSRKPVKFTFYNTKTKTEKEVTIKPTVFYWPDSNLDYAAINAMNDDAILERKSPLDFCATECLSDSIFDPYTSASENIVQY